MSINHNISIHFWYNYCLYKIGRSNKQLEKIIIALYWVSIAKDQTETIIRGSIRWNKNKKNSKITMQPAKRYLQFVVERIEEIVDCSSHDVNLFKLWNIEKTIKSKIEK